MSVNQAHEVFANLRKLRERRPTAVRCEFCSAELADEHPHLFEPGGRKLSCACAACALLFDGKHTRYKRVPRHLRRLTGFQLTDGQWDSLMIPIEMAFFFHSSAAGKVVAMYPSPAGATESLLPLEAWNDLAEDHPELKSLEPDVEALLANRASGQYYTVPIDECFKLVGLIRTHWRGFSGGAQVWEEISRFFAALDRKAAAEEAHA